MRLKGYEQKCQNRWFLNRAGEIRARILSFRVRYTQELLVVSEKLDGLIRRMVIRITLHYINCKLFKVAWVLDC